MSLSAKEMLANMNSKPQTSSPASIPPVNTQSTNSASVYEPKQSQGGSLTAKQMLANMNAGNQTSNTIIGAQVWANRVLALGNSLNDYYSGSYKNRGEASLWGIDYNRQASILMKEGQGYKGQYDAETESYIDELLSALQSLQSGANELGVYFGQYENEEEYTLSQDVHSALEDPSKFEQDYITQKEGTKETRKEKNNQFWYNLLDSMSLAAQSYGAASTPGVSPNLSTVTHSTADWGAYEQAKGKFDDTKDKRNHTKKVLDSVKGIEYNAAEMLKWNSKWAEIQEAGLGAADWYKTSEDSYYAAEDKINLLIGERNNIESNARLYDEEGNYLGEADVSKEIADVNARIDAAKIAKLEASEEMAAAGERMSLGDYEKLMAGLSEDDANAKRKKEIYNKEIYNRTTGKIEYHARMADDFETLSTPEETMQSTSFLSDQVDKDYDFINKTYVNEGKEYLGRVSLVRQSQLVSMNDDERQIFNYLYATDKEKASEYLDRIKNRLSARSTESLKGKMSTFSKRYPVLADIVSVPLTLMSGVGLADIALQNITRSIGEEYKPINYNSTGMLISNSATAIRSTQAKQLTDEYGSIEIDPESNPFWAQLLNGKNYGDVYNLGMSTLDSFAVAGIGKLFGLLGAVAGKIATTAGVAMLGGAAGSQGVINALERGATDNQALVMGLANATFEFLFEYWSIDRLVNCSARTIGATCAQAGIEGSEEWFTSVANTIADVSVMRDKSEFQLIVSKYMKQGMSPEDAEKAAMKDLCVELWWDAAGGFLMGGLHSATFNTISSATQSLSDNRTYKGTGAQSPESIVAAAKEAAADDYYPADMKTESGDKPHFLAGQAKRMTPLVSAVNNVKSKIAAGERITRGDMSKIVQATTEKKQNALRDETEKQLAEAGIHDSELVTKIISAALTGNALTDVRADQRDAAEAVRAQVEGKIREEQERVTLETLQTVQAAYEKAYATEAKSSDGNGSEASVGDRDGKIIALTRDNGVLKAVFESDGKTETVALEDISTDPGTDHLMNALALYHSAPEMFAAYQAGQNITDYISAWETVESVYGAMSDATAADVGKNITAILSQEQIEKALDAGHKSAEKEAKDIAMREEAKQRGIELGGKRRQGTCSFGGAVVNGREYAAIDLANLTDDEGIQVYAVTMLAQVTGIDFIFYRSTVDKAGFYLQSSGVYTGGAILIDINSGRNNVNDISKTAILRTAAHELTHYLKDYAPAEYRTLQRFLFNNLLEYKGKTLDQLVQDKVDRSGGKINKTTAADEVTADACEMMLKNTDIMGKLADEQVSVGETVKEFLDRWISLISEGMRGLSAQHEEAAFIMERNAEEMQKLWDKAIVAAVNNAQRESAKTQEKQTQKPLHNKTKAEKTTTVTETTNLPKYEEYTEDQKKYVKDIEDWDVKDHGGYFQLGNTTTVLTSFGIPTGKIYFDHSKAVTALTEHEEVTIETLKRIPSVLNSPIVVAESYDNTALIFGELYDNAKHPIVVAIRIKSTARGSSIEIVNKIRSVGTRTHDLDKLLAESKIVYLAEDKNRTEKWFQALGRSTPFGGIKSGSIRMLSFADQIVKAKDNGIKQESKKTTIVTDTVLKSERERDEQYMQAVQSGDMETAQDMVDEAAKKAGYNYRRNSNNKLDPVKGVPWQQFVKAESNMELLNYGRAFFAATADGATDISEIISDIEKLAADYYQRAIDYNEINPRDIVDSAGIWDDMEFVQFLWDNLLENQYLSSGKVPAIITSDGMIVMGEDSHRVKSADPVTYDNKGTVIPLSRRFDTGIEDIRYSERDYRPDERELLLSAAAEGQKGQIGEELATYAKKVTAMGVSRRRADALKAAYDAETDSENKKKIGEKLNKETARLVRYEKALEKMESSPNLKRAAQRQAEKWAEKSPQEVMELMRALREENRELRDYLDYFKKQSRLTPADKRKIKHEDAYALAKHLLEKNGSISNRDKITKWIEELGEYMLGDELDMRVIREQASDIADEILTGVYEDIDDNKELRENIRATLRGTPLKISDQLRGDMPDFDRFRKANMGIVNLANEGTSIDSFYEAMTAEFGEGLFPSDIMAESDRLNQMIDVARYQLQPMSVPVYNGDIKAAVINELANEIIDIMLSPDIHEETTLRDRETARVLKAVAGDVVKAQDELKAERADRQQIIQEKVGELYQRSEERREKFQKRKNIDKIAKRLTKYITNNDKHIHVPEEMKESIGRYLLVLDTLSPQAGETTRDLYVARLKTLQATVLKIINYQLGGSATVKIENGGYIDLPPDISDKIEGLATEAEAAGKTFSIYNMTLTELEETENLLSVISRAITEGNKALAQGRSARIDAEAAESVEYLDGQSALHKNRKVFDPDSPKIVKALRKLLYGATDSVEKMLIWDNTTPAYFFARYGAAGERVYKSLTDGWGRFAFKAKEIMDFAADAYSAKQVQDAEADIHKFELHYRISGTQTEGEEAQTGLTSEETETVYITRAQMMSLYELYKREQGKGHLMAGGIKIGRIKGDSGNFEQSDHYVLTQEDVATICDELTDEDKALADKLQKHMATVGSQWGNEVTMRRWGTREFLETDYWPIRTDSTSRQVTDTEGRDGANLFRLLNMSFTKATTPNANNAVVLESAFDVHANHMTDMAKYNCLALPMLDAVKWFSYADITASDEDGRYTTISLQKSSRRVYGNEGKDYFVQLLKDLNGSYEGGVDMNVPWSKLFRNYKIAAVAANLRVALLQPTSYVRALTMLDGKFLTHGYAHAARGVDKALKYSGAAVWKDLGYFDTNINKSLRDQIKHTTSATDKIRDVSLGAAKLGDKITWGAIWEACELEISERTELKGEELMKATAERFDDVIYKTQVMDSTLTRSSNMRKKGILSQGLTAFMAEPTLSYNIFTDAAYNKLGAEFRRTGNIQEAWKTVKTPLTRAVLGYAAAAIAASIVESIVDAFRDDDDYQEFWEKFLEAWFGYGKKNSVFESNLFTDLDLLNKIPAIKDVLSIMSGNSASRIDVDSLATTYKAFGILKETWQLATGKLDEPTKTTYYGKMTTYGVIYNAMKALSQVSGIPASNALRTIATVWNNTVGVWTGKKWRTYDPGSSGAIKNAYLDGFLSDERAQGLLLSEGVTDDADKAAKTVYEWGLEGGDKWFTAVTAAAKAGDKSAFEAATEELTDIGYTTKSVEEKIRASVKEWYQGTEKEPESISKTEAIKMLTDFGGLSAKDAEATVQQWTSLKVTGIAYGDIKEAYLDGDISEADAIKMKVTYGGMRGKNAAAEVQTWKVEKETGIAYDEIKEAYLDGDISAKEAAHMKVTYGGMSSRDAESVVQKWNCEKETGVDYEKMEDAYLEGDISDKKAVELRVKYGGNDELTAAETVLKWQCEKETGIVFAEMKDAYLAGEINAEKAKKLLMEYGGSKAETAEKSVNRWDFVGNDPDLQAATSASVAKYGEYFQNGDMNKKVYVDAYIEIGKIYGEDLNGDGENDRYTAMDKKLAYINTLPLTAAQKTALARATDTGSEENIAKRAPW